MHRRAFLRRLVTTGAAIALVPTALDVLAAAPAPAFNAVAFVHTWPAIQVARQDAIYGFGTFSPGACRVEA